MTKKTHSDTPDDLAARALAEVEARAAAAHARELAEAEAAAEPEAATEVESSVSAVPTNDSPAAIAARVSGPRRVVTLDDDEDEDDDDEDAYDDRWDDASYSHH